MQAAWFFGANRSGEPVYDPATGVTYDGVQPDGTINRNSGAESTIHGLLSMLALDAHPRWPRGRRRTAVAVRDGLTAVEAEAAASTTGTVATPVRRGRASRSTAVTCSFSSARGGHVRVGSHEEDRSIEPVPGSEDAKARSIWNAGRTPLGTLDGRGEPQGISPVPGVLLPRTLQQTLPATSASVSARVVTDGPARRPHRAAGTLTPGARGHGRRDRARSLGGKAAAARGRRLRRAQRDRADLRPRREPARPRSRSAASATVRIPSGGFAVVSTVEAG